MPGPDVSGRARYGLTVKAYDPKVPLDPLACPTDSDLLVGYEGLTEVELYIDRAIELCEPAFVMVAGIKGTGRTSVCNHLLRHYRDERKRRADPDVLPLDEPFKLVVPEPAYPGADGFGYFSNWLQIMYYNLAAKGLTPLGNEAIDLDGELKGDPLPVEKLYLSKAQVILTQTSRVLAGKGAGFAVRLEDPPQDLIKPTFAICDQAETITLVTVLDAIEAPGTGEQQSDLLKDLFRSRPRSHESARERGGYPILELGPVRGKQARDIIERRWKAGRTGVRLPFDNDGLVDTFDRRHRPAARIVLMTSEMFDMKLAEAWDGPAWPDDEKLFFSAEQIPRYVEVIDRRERNAGV